MKPYLLGSLVFTASLCQAAPIIIANASFESPTVTFAEQVTTNMPGWTQTPPPAGYNPALGPWETGKGIFPNVPPGFDGHIENPDGNQLAYLFAAVGNGIFQDLNATYEPGLAYALFGHFTSSFYSRLQENSTLELQLYYRNSANLIIPIAGTVISYSTNTFNFTRLTAHSISLPSVKTTDPWANKTIGIRILATPAQTAQGGAWDIDNILLNAIPETIPVANHSFETPTVSFQEQVSTNMPFWQQTPEPAGYNPQLGPWHVNRGTFPNIPPGFEGNINNADQNQLAYLTSEPGNGIYQDLTNKYEPGAAYLLSVGITSSYYARLREGNVLRLEFFYRNALNEIVPVGARIYTYTTNLFSFTSLRDALAWVGPIQPTDPMANKNIGIRILSASTEETKGGVWDLDNVRVTTSAGIRVEATAAGENIRLRWKSIPGYFDSVMVSHDFQTWMPLGAPIENRGEPMERLIPITPGENTFYTVRSAPFFN